jgi:hypothetical protein
MLVRPMAVKSHNIVQFAYGALGEIRIKIITYWIPWIS